MAESMTANAITSKQRVATKQRIAGPFEMHVIAGLADFEPRGCEPLLVVRHFSLALWMSKASHDGDVLVNERRVGREHHVRQAGLRRQKLDRGSRFFQQLLERRPLLAGSLPIALPLPVHPRIDFVLNSIVIRRAHED